ncbi:NB-ARC domain-containing protein [Micromonospora sp. NPDC003944]
MSVAVSLLTSIGAVAINALTNVETRWPAGLENIRRYPFRWTVGVTVATAFLTWLSLKISAHRDRSPGDPLPPLAPIPERWIVPRGRELEEVVEAIRRRRTTSAVGITTALRGAGGFGKTTLARIVCADHRVQKHFGRKIYMITMGRDCRGPAPIADKINDLVELITGERPGFADPRLAGQHLGRLLGERGRMLVVLDDVWEEDQLTPFLQGGPEAVRLVTTRSPAVLPEKAITVKVDQMSEDQARRLLGWEIPDLAPDAAEALLRHTGRWPLLLRLVNRILHRHATLGHDTMTAASSILARLRDHGPAAVDDLGLPTASIDLDVPEQRARAVRATIEAGTTLLGNDAAERLGELSIFAEDERFDLETVTRLWTATAGLDEISSAHTAAELANLSLTTIDQEGGRSYLQLHDVVRAFLRGNLGEQRLHELNRTFLDAMAITLPEEQMLRPSAENLPVTAWWRLEPSADYLWRHLAYHLCESGDMNRATDLITDLRWIAEKLVLAGPVAVAVDLSLVRDPRSRVLRRVLLRSANLLTETDPARSVVAIFASRLLDERGWGPEIRRLLALEVTPQLVGRFSLPDAPHTSLLRVMPGGHTQVLALATADRGRILLAGGGDGTVRAWSTVTGLLTRSYEANRDWVRSLSTFAEGRFVAAGDDGSASLFDVTDEGPVARAKFDGSWVMSVVMVDEHRVVASTREGVTYLHDFRDSTSKELLSDFLDPVLSGCLLKGGWDVALGSSAGRVHLVDLASSKVRTLDLGTGQPVLGLVADPSEGFIASAGGQFYIWHDGDFSDTFSIDNPGVISALSMSMIGEWLAWGTEYGAIEVQDRNSGHRTSFNGHQARVTAIVSGPDGEWIASASEDGAIRIWDPAVDVAEDALSAGLQGRLRSLTVIGDDDSEVAAVGDGVVRTWNTRTGASTDATRPLRFDSNGGRLWRNIVPGSGRRWIGVVRADGSIVIRDATKGVTLCTLNTLMADPVTVAASHGAWLASTTADGIKVWEAETDERYSLPTSLGTKSIVRALAAAPDGSWLASSVERGIEVFTRTANGVNRRLTLSRLWQAGDELTNDRIIHLDAAPDSTWLAAHTASGAVLVFTMPAAILWHSVLPPGRASVLQAAQGGAGIVVGCRDGGLLVLETQTGVARAAGISHRDAILSIASSPRGDRLATVSADRTVRLWQVDSATIRCLAMLRTEADISEVVWLPDDSGIAVTGVRGLYLLDFHNL